MRDSSYDGKVPLLKYGDISTASDVDIYDLDKVDFYFGPVTVKFKTSGLSLLQGKIEILDKAGKIISSATSTVRSRLVTDDSKAGSGRLRACHGIAGAVSVPSRTLCW